MYQPTAYNEGADRYPIAAMLFFPPSHARPFFRPPTPDGMKCSDWMPVTLGTTRIRLLLLSCYCRFPTPIDVPQPLQYEHRTPGP